MATATIDLSVQVQDTAAAGLGRYSGNPAITTSASLTSADVSLVYSAGRSVSTADTLDVTSGLTSAYGAALTYSTVRAVAIWNTSATATVTVGGGLLPLFGTDQYTVRPGQSFSVPACPATVDGTHKVITVTTSAAATYSVLVLGS
jgi:hypothetical protein